MNNLCNMESYYQQYWRWGDEKNFRRSLDNAHKVRPRCDLNDWTLADAARFWIGNNDGLLESMETFDIPDGFVVVLAATMIMRSCAAEHHRRYVDNGVQHMSLGRPLANNAYFPVYCERLQQDAILSDPICRSPEDNKVTQSHFCRSLFRAITEHDTCTHFFSMDIPTAREYCARTHCTANDSSMPQCVPQVMWEKHPEFFTSERLNYQGVYHLWPAFRSALTSEPPTISIKRQRSHKLVPVVPRMTVEILESFRMNCLSYVKEAGERYFFREQLKEIIGAVGQCRLQYRFILSATGKDVQMYLRKFDLTFLRLLCWKWKVMNPLCDNNSLHYWGLEQDQWSSLAKDVYLWDSEPLTY